MGKRNGRGRKGYFSTHLFFVSLYKEGITASQNTTRGSQKVYVIDENKEDCCKGLKRVPVTHILVNVFLFVLLISGGSFCSIFSRICNFRAYSVLR